MQRHLDAGQGGVVGLGDLEPVHVHAHILQEFAHLEPVPLGADAHHLVEGRLDLDAAADEAGGDAAGQVVPFQHQHVQPLVRQHQRGT